LRASLGDAGADPLHHHGSLEFGEYANRLGYPTGQQQERKERPEGRTLHIPVWLPGYIVTTRRLASGDWSI
jgi:hypothetical protein